MFRIGDFSRIARVSCRLLRYYDEIGLLRPAVVDPASGYRSYTAAQLPQLNRILVLKDLGLNLDQVARVIENKVTAAELRAMLLVRRADAAQAIAAESDRLRQIESRIQQIEAEGRLSVDDVVIRTEPACWVLSSRTTIESFAAARTVIRALVEATARAVPKPSLGALIAIAHASDFEPDVLDVEFGFILNEKIDATVPLPGGGALRVRELPQVDRLAACVRVGLPEDAHPVTARIGMFAEANGFTLAGPSREVFLRPPHPDRMHESIVEMQFPLAPLDAPQPS